MYTNSEFCALYKNIIAIESQILDTNRSIKADLFTNEENLEFLKFFQPQNLRNYIKPLPKTTAQPIEIHPIHIDPKTIAYNYFLTSYGKLLIATSDLGVCFVSFESDENISELQKQFPNSKLEKSTTELHEIALDFLEDKLTDRLDLHVKGTKFQLQVWRSLLKIKIGQLSTYKHIASAIDKPTASRAIGAAVGKNPIALFIPCHRVVRSTGIWKGFRWGNMRKATLLVYELM